ncbi:hypothetical protein [Pseudonocardia sp. N23]|uniref:hypothetical protein n=1 Tax=Pseudonocardia sp. N23 TaxID=1987376 RepID=UPI0015597833|nr:hypothetical protein [Pseudonocardia sp. N23]
MHADTVIGPIDTTTAPAAPPTPTRVITYPGGAEQDHDRAGGQDQAAGPGGAAGGGGR